MAPSLEHIRALERLRTQALVEQDMALAQRLHAPEYQLITPSGKSYERDRYLDDIATGRLRYAKWECGEMDVRVSEAMALVRYQARLEFPSGKTLDCWHTDSYELRDGNWLAVWSQATAIATATAIAEG